LAEDQAQGLYSFDERDLSMEMEKLHERVPGGEDERAVEAEQLSQSVREISDALVDLDTFPIQDIPLQPRSPKDVLTASVSFWSGYGRSMPPAIVHKSETRPVQHHCSPSYSTCHFFAFGVCVYISIFLHILMYKKVCALTFPRRRSPSRSKLGFLGSD
jgi:hypothetical protein